LIKRRELRMIYKMLDTGKNRPVYLTIEFERVGDEVMISMIDEENEFSGGVMTVPIKDWGIMVNSIRKV
jgi:hypothetical protein